MKKIEFDHPHQRRHFEFFSQMELPHFGVTAPVDFSDAYNYIKTNKLHFTSVVVYLICRAANGVPQMRRRIRDGQIVQHESVHPSFTVTAEDTGVFTFCYVDYREDFESFSHSLRESIDFVKRNPTVSDEPGRDDYLFLSALPWVHFTGISHAMPIANVDSVPRITWGKLGGSGGLQLPLSVQAHHAVVDGSHVGRFYQLFEEYCADPERYLAQ